MDLKSNVNSRVLHYYLERIHAFLLSEKKSQIFPELSQDIEEVLIKIATEREFLLGECFDDDCKSLSRKILKVLEDNKEVFQLHHSFDRGVDDKKVLMYKKTNMFQKPTPLRSPGTIKLTQMPTSLDDEVTTSFKLRCLNATLKFIKDDTQLVLKFPDMVPSQADFVYTMLTEKEAEIGFGYKSLFAPIWEAIRIFELKYSFRVYFDVARLQDMKRVVFEKIPLNMSADAPNGQVKESCINVYKPSLERTVTLTQIPLKNKQTPKNTTVTKKEAKLLKLKDTIQELNPVLISDYFKKTSQFVSDEKQASIFFENLKPDSVQFIMNLMNVVRKSCYHMYLPSDCTEYINVIRHWTAKELWTVTIKEDKVKNGLKTLKMTKEVRFNDGSQALQLNTSFISNDSSLKTRMNRTSTPISLSRSASVASLSSLKSNGSKISNKEKENKNAKPKSSTNKTRDRSLSIGRKVARKTNGTLLKSSSLTKLNTSNNEKGKKKVNITKAKLIEGLSQPVQSDIGMKMMKNMGWQGGALGLRGEGIVEPITLNLDSKIRAGFGCVPKPTPQTPKPTPQTSKPKPQTEGGPEPQTVEVEPHSNYHIATMNNILDVLNSNLKSKIFVYPPSVMSKEWSFIKHIIKIANSKGNMGLANELNDLSIQIVDIMKKNKDVTLTACLGTNNKSVLITKASTPHNKFWKETTCDQNVEVQNEQTTDMGWFRHFVMTNVLNFCKMDLDSKEITTSGELVKKRKSFIRSFLKSLNKNNESGFANMELDVFREIRDLKKSFTLEVVFNNKHNFCLKKLYEKQKKIILSQHPSVNTRIGMYDPNGVENGITDKTKKTVNETDITGNKTDITGNKTDITGNKSDITGTKSDIRGTKSDITCNKSDIMGTKSDIRGTKSDITCNKSDIMGNKTDIISNKGDVTGQRDITGYKDDKLKYIGSDYGKTVLKSDTSEINSDNVAVDYIMPVDTVKTVITEIKSDKNIPKDSISDMTNNDNKFDKNEGKVTLNDDNLNLTESIDISTIIDSDLESELLASDEENSRKENSNNFNKSIKNPIGINIENVTFANANVSTPKYVGFTENARDKNIKSMFKTFKIVPSDYPHSVIDKEKSATIQQRILATLDSNKELPLLKCHGIKNGGLKYSCQNEYSFNFLTDIIESDNNFKLVYDLEYDRQVLKKIMFRINTFLEENVCDTLSRLSMYNKDLNIDKWVVTKKEQSSDYVIVYVSVDKKSYDYIKGNNFVIYAGVDQAKFSIIWD